MEITVYLCFCNLHFLFIRNSLYWNKLSVNCGVAANIGPPKNERGVTAITVIPSWVWVNRITNEYIWNWLKIKIPMSFHHDDKKLNQNYPVKYIWMIFTEGNWEKKNMYGCDAQISSYSLFSTDCSYLPLPTEVPTVAYNCTVLFAPLFLPSRDSHRQNQMENRLSCSSTVRTSRTNGC